MSRAILKTVLLSDAELNAPERSAMQDLIDGNDSLAPAIPGVLAVSHQTAAQLLSVDRITVWRMAKNRLVHPVEILPGTWRYAFIELEELARCRWKGKNAPIELSAHS